MAFGCGRCEELTDMSRTTLSVKTRLLVWVRAGGRCEYPGCNKLLLRDDLTATEMNRSYFAHIVADSPDGLRGDPVLSPLLKDDPSNVMLLCDDHHRLIDREAVAEHPVDVLARYKREHEERIESLTGMHPSMRSHVVLFGTRISTRAANVNYDQARDAMLPDHYPVVPGTVCLDISDLDVNEGDPNYYPLVQQLVDRKLLELESLMGQSGVNHASVFALAPIPALIYFGHRLGDIRKADVHQLHRGALRWKWKDVDKPLDLQVDRRASVARSPEIVVLLSLSDPVDADAFRDFLGKSLPTYAITMNAPRLDFLQTREQVEEFLGVWRVLIGETRRSHGNACQVHLVPAIPNAIAVEIGRSLNPKTHPRLHIYDYNSRWPDQFRLAMTI